MDIFSSGKLSDHVTRIIEITGTYMYLVEGKATDNCMHSWAYGSFRWNAGI